MHISLNVTLVAYEMKQNLVMASVSLSADLSRSSKQEREVDNIVAIIAKGKKRRSSEHVFRSSRLLDHDESQKETTLPTRSSSSERWKGPPDNHSTSTSPSRSTITTSSHLLLLPYLRNPHRADANNVCRYIASHASLAPQIVL